MTDDEKWNTEQIALFTGLSRKTVTNRLTKRQGFPKPVVATSQKNRWWLAREVREHVAGCA